MAIPNTNQPIVPINPTPLYLQNGTNIGPPNQPTSPPPTGLMYYDWRNLPWNGNWRDSFVTPIVKYGYEQVFNLRDALAKIPGITPTTPPEVIANETTPTTISGGQEDAWRNNLREILGPVLINNLNTPYALNEQGLLANDYYKNLLTKDYFNDPNGAYAKAQDSLSYYLDPNSSNNVALSNLLNSFTTATPNSYLADISGMENDIKNTLMRQLYEEKTQKMKEQLAGQGQEVGNMGEAVLAEGNFLRDALSEYGAQTANLRLSNMQNAYENALKRNLMGAQLMTGQNEFRGNLARSLAEMGINVEQFGAQNQLAGAQGLGNLGEFMSRMDQQDIANILSALGYDVNQQAVDVDKLNQALNENKFEYQQGRDTQSDILDLVKYGALLAVL